MGDYYLFVFTVYSGQKFSVCFMYMCYLEVADLEIYVNSTNALMDEWLA